jgi:arylsulfatase A-like enzyme
MYKEARSTSSWTLPSHASLLTGLMPHQHGATHARNRDQRDEVSFRWSWVTRLRDDVPTLAGRLAGRGYRTGAIVANAAVLAHEMGLDRGFQHYDDRMSAGLECRQSLLQQLGWHPALGCLHYRDATTVTKLAQSWIKGNEPDQPFFLFLNYMDAHTPYIPPSPFDRAFSSRRPIDPLQPSQAMQSLQYDRQLLYLDSELMRLIDWLRSTDHWQQTVVIITSDHGEALGEHNHWGHAQYLYEELIHVPLLVRSVGAELDRPVTQLIGGDDVHDLALAELGLGPPPRLSSERLVAEWYCSANKEGICRSQDLLAWIEGNRKIIVQLTGEVEAYDLGQDRQELVKVQLSASEMDQARQRAEELWSIPSGASTAPELSPETIENLRALGYLK